jgi:hypothetical protein
VTDFGPENLPSAHGLDPPLGSDLTSWNYIYSRASDLVSGCAGHFGTPGWTVVGKKDNLHLIVSLQ